MIGVPALWQLLHRRLTQELAAFPVRSRRPSGARCAPRAAQPHSIQRREAPLLAHPQPFGGKLRLLVSGGQRLSEEVRKAFHELGFDLTEGYGPHRGAPVLSVTVPRTDAAREAWAAAPASKSASRTRTPRDGEVLRKVRTFWPRHISDDQRHGASGSFPRSAGLRTSDVRSTSRALTRSSKTELGHPTFGPFAKHLADSLGVGSSMRISTPGSAGPASVRTCSPDRH